MNNLIIWLKQQDESLSIRKLATKLNISHSHVAKMVRNETPVTWTFAAKVANEFEIEPIKAFEMAGLLKTSVAEKGSVGATGVVE